MCLLMPELHAQIYITLESGMKLLMKQVKTGLIFLGVFCLFMLLSSCGGGGGSNGGGGSGGVGSDSGSGNTPSVPGSGSAKEITSYKVNGIDANINQQAKSISLVVPYGTDLSNVSVIFTTTGSKVKVGSITHQTTTVAVTHDFTHPIDYLVTAIDGSTASYTAAVIIAPDTAKEIIAFSLNGINANVIDEASKTISVVLPYGTDLNNLFAKFTTTGIKVAVDGIAQINTGQTVSYFNNPTHEAFYMVTSAKGETQAYTVKVTLASISAATISAFSVNGVVGNIDEVAKTISVIIPYDTDRSNLLVRIVTEGQSVFVNNNQQTMESIVTHFATDEPVLYKVVAHDGTTTQTYTVKVMTGSNSDTRITKFLAGGVLGNIDETAKTILVVLPYETDRSSLLVRVTTEGKSLSVNGNNQGMETYVTHFNTGTAVPYTIVAADGKTTSTYLVSVVLAPPGAAVISEFSLGKSLGIIDPVNRTISVILPADTDTSSLIAEFTTEGGGHVFDNDGTPVITGQLVTHFKSTLSVTYKVVSQDGKVTQPYMINISLTPNTTTVIKDLFLNGYKGNIDQLNKTILVHIPTGTDITSLEILFATEGKARLLDKSGKQVISGGLVTHFTPQGLSVPYTVIAEDEKTTTDYTVTIVMDNNADARISEFLLDGYSGTIDQFKKTISVILPYNTNPQLLKLEYVTNGTFSINSKNIDSGVPVGDFAKTNTAFCDVISKDGKTAVKYTVNITIAKSNVAVISEFFLGGVLGKIDPAKKTIMVSLPYGTNPASLQILFKTEGEGNLFDKNNKRLATGDLVSDFDPTLSSSYKVVAGDGITTQTYVVTATIAADDTKEIKDYKINGISGIYNGNNISVTLPVHADSTKLVATFTPIGKAKVGTADQISGTTENDFSRGPVEYLVTAADGTSRSFYVTVNFSLWKWQGGSHIPNKPNTETAPGGRSHGSTIVDRDGNFLLFGGATNDGTLSDLWMWNKTKQVWQFLSKGSPTSVTNKTGSYPVNIGEEGTPGSRAGAVTWKDANGEIWMFGGYGRASLASGHLNDLWNLRNDAKGWTWFWMGGQEMLVDVPSEHGLKGVESPKNMPGGRRFAASWTDKHGDLWMFGGEFLNHSNNTTYYYNDLWRYNIARKSWTWMKGDKLPNKFGRVSANPDENDPGSRSNATRWVDTEGNLWLFGGYSYWTGGGDTHSEHYYNDLWKFNVSLNRWILVRGIVESDGKLGDNQAGNYGSTIGISTDKTVPGGRYGSASWIDEKGNLWLYGGQGGSSDGIVYTLNDLWRFSFSDSRWTWMGGDEMTKANYDESVTGVYDGEPWKMKPGSREMAHSWSDDKGNLWLFGGLGYGRVDTNKDVWYGHLNDFWVYNYK